MNTPEWIRIAAASKEELAAEADKLINDLGGYDAAFEALEAYEGLGIAKKASWVVPEKFSGLEEDALKSRPKPPESEKKEESKPEDKPEIKKPKKPRQKKTKEVTPEVVEPKGEPADKPMVVRPEYATLAPEEKKEATHTLIKVMIGLGLFAAGMGVSEWTQHRDASALKAAIHQYLKPTAAPTATPSAPLATPVKAPEGTHSKSPFNWKAQDRVTGETLFDAEVQKIQKHIDNMNKALRPDQQKKLNDWVYDSEQAYRKVFLKDWHLPKINYNRGA